MVPNLETVKTLTKKYPNVITPGGLRWEIFNADKNGLSESGAIIRHGRKILINADLYFEWLCSQKKTG